MKKITELLKIFTLPLMCNSCVGIALAKEDFDATFIAPNISPTYCMEEENCDYDSYDNYSSNDFGNRMDDYNISEM